MTDETDPPDPAPTSETQRRRLDEVHTNHMSPMGQVEAIGRFARGVGPERLRRYVRVGIVVLATVLVVAIVVSALG